MQTRFMAEKPNDITFTLKIEATAAEFFELRDELHRYGQRALPAPLTEKLTIELGHLLAASRKTFYPSDGPPHVIGPFMGHIISVDPAMPEHVKDVIRRRLGGDGNAF